MDKEDFAPHRRIGVMPGIKVFGDYLAQESTPDDDAGMAWWNGLSEADRCYWCLAAMTAVPADAWKYFRLVTAPRRLVKKVSGDD